MRAVFRHSSNFISIFVYLAVFCVDLGNIVSGSQDFKRSNHVFFDAEATKQSVKFVCSAEPNKRLLLNILLK